MKGGTTYQARPAQARHDAFPRAAAYRAAWRLHLTYSNVSHCPHSAGSHSAPVEGLSVASCTGRGPAESATPSKPRSAQKAAAAGSPHCCASRAPACQSRHQARAVPFASAAGRSNCCVSGLPPACDTKWWCHAWGLARSGSEAGAGGSPSQHQSQACVRASKLVGQASSSPDLPRDPPVDSTASAHSLGSACRPAPPPLLPAPAATGNCGLRPTLPSSARYEACTQATPAGQRRKGARSRQHWGSDSVHPAFRVAAQASGPCMLRCAALCCAVLC